MNQIITISREFGSGGREFGRRLAEELGIPYYDQEIIQEIAKRVPLSEWYIQTITEHRPIFSYPIHIGRSFYSPTATIWDQTLQVYQMQARIITEMAENSDCVIVGRCANFILREKKPFRFFIYADMQSKIKRCREKAPEGELLTDDELVQKIKRTDRNRAKYYESYSGLSWGDKLDFDLCLNTSNVAIKNVVPGIADIFRGTASENHSDI